MKRISSFSVNHDTLEKGIYISRIDGDVVTYDIRMRKPNGGDYLQNGAIHTVEHLFATFVRNSPQEKAVIYFGPMGCRTGFYFIVRDTVSHEQVIALVQNALTYISGFTGEIPGSKKEECGNYLDHDLQGARREAKEMADVLKDWKEADLYYKP